MTAKTATGSSSSSAAGASTSGSAKKLTLTFGLVNVPIRLKSLSEVSSPIAAKTLCPTHHVPVKMGPWVCPNGDHTVARDSVVKGYPHPDNKKQLVVMDVKELEEYAEERTGNADIRTIVDVSTIDPAYFDRCYIVDVGEGANAQQSFDLFVSVLRDHGKAAVTTTVMNKRTRTVIFRWSEQFGLLAHLCRFQSQIRLGDVAAVSAVAALREPPPPEMIELAEQIFSSLEGEFDPGEVDDTWVPLVQGAIRQAAEGQPFEAPETDEEPKAPAGDLMAALKASVVAAKKPAEKEPTAEKPAVKRSTRKKATA